MARLRLEVAEALKKEAGDEVSPALPLPMLRKGSSGLQVAQLQDMLNKLGYDCGTVDGVFGRKTQTAVKKFQADAALTKDGVVGPATWQALNEAYTPEGVG